MSTSLLYHAFGIRGYRHVRTDFCEGAVLFTIEQARHTLRCPVCHSREVTAHGGVPRLFRGVPIGPKPTAVFLQIPRVECHVCQITRQVDVPFAEPRRRHTRAFERYALDLSRHMTIQDVALHLGVSWDTIKEIQKSYLQRHYGKPKLHKLKQIAIDEIAIAKGHRYLTVVLDLESGAVVFVGDGKGGDALKPFWKRLRRCKAKIVAVAMDMSPAYHDAVSSCLPEATIVYDRFHVMKLFNEKPSDLRRALHREATDVLQKKVLKGTRWPLLKC